MRYKLTSKARQWYLVRSVYLYLD